MVKEQELAKARAWEAKTGKKSKKAETLAAQVRKMKEGGFKSKKVGKSGYRKDAEKFGKQFGGTDYWLEPTEMFARAFEAYVAEIVTQRGGSTEFITKQDEAYKLTLEQVEGADARLALTYPNEPDRQNIKLAMDRLMEAVQAEFWEGAAQAHEPGNYDMIDANLDFAAQIDEGNSKKQLKEAWATEGKARRVAKANANRTRPQRYPDLSKDWKGRATRHYRNAMDATLTRSLWTKRAILFEMSGRYKGNQGVTARLEQIIRRVATDPGGERITFKGGTFEEAVTIACLLYTSPSPRD